MKTLAELRKDAQRVFPGQNETLPRLLAAWAASDSDGELPGLLQGTGLDPESMKDILEQVANTPLPGDMQFWVVFTRLSGETPLARDLLGALCDVPEHRIARALTEAGLRLDRLRAQLEATEPPSAGFLERVGIPVGIPDSPLLHFGRELTAEAEAGAFDALCDRPKEIERVLEVLLRKQKGNVALTGQAGVGKTALVELLARKIVRKAAPEPLLDRRIFEVSMGKLVAGTRYRGDFEARMEAVLDAAQAMPGTILFIDEMHLIWGAGHAEGVITDAANLLKPVLARGAVRVIGATTVKEYRQYIARDAALARRFQAVA